jgi:hypothetical protein
VAKAVGVGDSESSSKGGRTEVEWAASLSAGFVWFVGDDDCWFTGVGVGVEAEGGVVVGVLVAD